MGRRESILSNTHLEINGQRESSHFCLPPSLSPPNPAEDPGAPLPNQRHPGRCERNALTPKDLVDCDKNSLHLLKEKVVIWQREEIYQSSTGWKRRRVVVVGGGGVNPQHRETAFSKSIM